MTTSSTLGGDGAFPEDEDTVAQTEKLGQFGGNEEDGGAVSCQPLDDVVDLAFRGDVDATRRLVPRRSVWAD